MPFASLAALTLACFSGAALSSASLASGAASDAPLLVAAVATPAPAKAAPARAQAQPKPVAQAPVSQPESAAGALAFSGLSDAAIVEKARAAIEAITTFKADFVQTAPSGAVSTGTFYLRRPGLLRFEYDPPSPLLIVATGGTVFVKDDALDTTDSYPVGKTPLKYLLKKRVELDEAKILRVERGADSVAVAFASDKDEDEGELVIVLAAPDLTLKEWLVRDPQNGETHVALENIVRGESLPNRLFAAPETGSTFLKN
jgi:outer membrane lipoprotein-sorting protein